MFSKTGQVGNRLRHCCILSGGRSIRKYRTSRVQVDLVMRTTTSYGTRFTLVCRHTINMAVSIGGCWCRREDSDLWGHHTPRCSPACAAAYVFLQIGTARRRFRVSRPTLCLGYRLDHRSSRVPAFSLVWVRVEFTVRVTLEQFQQYDDPPRYTIRHSTE